MTRPETSTPMTATDTVRKARCAYTVALAGNPNCGKSTLFNALTGGRAHVGNYPGITVETKSGQVQTGDAMLTVVDLPGTYSLTAYSAEELVARDYLVGERPQAVVAVLNAGSLERNLYLAVQLLELGIPLVLGLNMMDEARKMGLSIDTKRLGSLLRCPVVELVARVGIGVGELARAAADVAGERNGVWHPFDISYGPDLDPVLDEMTSRIENASFLADLYPARWVALKYLEGDDQIKEQGLAADHSLSVWLDAKALELAEHLRATLGTYPEAVVADYRYGFIAAILKGGVVSRDDLGSRIAATDRIDKVLTHKFLGPVIMFAVLYLVYLVAFSLGKYPMEWLQTGFDWLGSTVESTLDEGLLRSLLVDGIIAGVGGVLGFVPLIMIIFGLIAFLEDSGYMARIAYMLDRVFRIFGLHGCSVMPFIISGGIAGGCAVPGVLASRTLRSPKERLATILTLPLMTCGAKMPVFIMLTAAFLPKYQAQAMFGLTLFGWVMAMIVSWLLRTTLVRGESTPFVMELPPYRLPTWRGIFIHTWERTWQYAKKAGTFILAVSILVWAAMTFPGLPEERIAAYDAQKTAVAASIESPDAAADNKTGNVADVKDAKSSKDAINAQKPENGVSAGQGSLKNLKAQIEDIDKARQAETLTSSFAGRLGASLEPVSRLAGFDWRTDIALVGGVAAKEIIISTMGTAYSLGKVDKEDSAPLVERLANSPDWNAAAGVALMIFILLYSPCFPTVVMIGKETGSWKWPTFSVVFNTALAFGLAVTVYQIGTRLIL